MSVPPFERTGKVLFDALLLTLHCYGCERITHDRRIITCTRAGQPFVIPVTAQTSCVDILICIGLIQPMRKELNRAA